MSNSNRNIRNPASEIKVVFYAGNNRLDGHNASSVKSNLLRLLFFVAAKLVHTFASYTATRLREKTRSVSTRSGDVSRHSYTTSTANQLSISG